MASASIAAAASKALAPAAAAAAAGSSAFFTHDIGVNFGSKKRYSDGAVARLMSEAWEGGVACVISITNCLSELPRNEALAARHEHLYFTVGVHPHSARGVTQESLEAAITRAVALPKCVAIGECGLDYDRMFSPQDEQLRVFRWQVALAKALDKPLYLHCRSKTGRSEAFHDMIGVRGRSRRSVDLLRVSPAGCPVSLVALVLRESHVPSSPCNTVSCLFATVLTSH